MAELTPDEKIVAAITAALVVLAQSGALTVELEPEPEDSWKRNLKHQKK